MLSTINWTNRGNNLNDTDGFAALFAGNAGLARQIVDRAIDDWEAVIQNFNYSGGGNTFSLQVMPAAITAIASAGITNISDGKPTSATISLQNVAATHWLDPTPLDNVEFANNVANAFTGFAAGISGTDLYATIIHEIGHAVGISQQFSTLSIAGFTTDTGIDDPNSATAGNLLAFNVGGGAVEATFTASDSGHLWEGPATAATNAAGLPVHLNDLMNSGRAINSNERNLISNTDATILQLAYGYTIVLPSSLGTYYDRLDPDGTLTIRPPAGNNNDMLDLQVSGGNLLVTLGLGAPVPGADPSTIISTFPTNLINNIVIDMGAGTDTVTIHPIYSSIPIALDMGAGAGFDVLNIWGGAGYDAITVSSPSLVSTGINLTSFSGVESLNLYTNGGDADIYLPNGGSALAATINGSGSAETIILHSLGLFTPATIFGNGGNDTITLAPNGGTDIIRAAVTVDGGTGADTLNLGNGTLASLIAAVTFNGGTGFEDKVVFNDQATTTATSYNVTSTAVTRSPTFGGLTYSDLDRIVINCGSGADTVSIANGVFPNVEAHGNNGDDNFIVGGGNLTGIQPQSFDGGLGNDQITFDNRLDATNRIWDIRPNEVIFGGLIVLSTASFESVGVLAGTGADEITFAGNFAQNLNIDGGGGFDQFLWNEAKNFYPLSGVYSVNLNGGDGINRLEITQAAQGALTFNVTGSRIYALGDPFDIFTGKPDINYSNFIAVFITAGPQADRFNVYDTEPSSNYTLNGGDGADYFYMQTDPAKRNNVTLNGQAGNDTLHVDDSIFANANVPYTFAAASGILLDRVVRNTGPLTITTYGYTSMQSLIVNGTTGNDTFNVDEAKSGTSFSIYGGPGHDTFNVGGGNLAANITNISALTFNGEDGSDTFNLHNEVSTSGFTYRRNAGSMSATGPSSYVLNISDSSTENIFMGAGSGSDVFRIYVVATGERLELSGGAGIDALLLGDLTSNVNDIRGPIIFDTGADAGRVAVVDTSSTGAKVAHLTPTSLGAHPDDTLFGPGGSLSFTTLVNQFAGINFHAMSMSLGSGADTIYAQPFSTGTVFISGGNPTTAPGDTLYLALATAENYVLNGTPANGNVTSTNLMTLSYSGFETGPIIMTPPDLVGDYNLNGAVDAADYVVWRKMLGTSVSQAFAGADGSGNYAIGPEDNEVWRAHFGQTSSPPGAGSGVSFAKESLALIVPADESPGSESSMSFSNGELNQTTDPLGTSSVEQATPVLIPAYSLFAPYRPAVRESVVAQQAFVVSRHDEALMAWLTSQPVTKEQAHDFESAETWRSEDLSDADDIQMDTIEQVIAELAN